MQTFRKRGHMQELEVGKERVKKICDILRKETLQPAREEADQILENARIEAEEIIQQAEKKAQQILEKAHQNIQKDKVVFEASLRQSYIQILETLRQAIEKKLMNQELKHLIAAQLQDPSVLASLISAVVQAIEKEGIEADLSAYISSTVSARSVNVLLAKGIIDRLKEKSVLLSGIGGGAEIKWEKENITIDISDESLKELLAAHIHKDFRDVFFGT